MRTIVGYASRAASADRAGIAARFNWPSGERTVSSPVARRWSSSLQTSTVSESRSPMPARIMGKPPVVDFAVAIAGLGRFRMEALRRFQLGLDRRDEARGVVTVDDPMID